jgi:hypothetical protein
MTFPPALTWMHILPAQSALECDTAVTDGLKDLISRASVPGGPRFRVSDHAEPSQLTNETTSDEGLVAINYRGADVARLSAAGFGHVRAFAVIPSLAEARWFIPLDSPAISSSAFAIYSPTRTLARVKRFAIQAAARSGFPMWYRDRILIAQRKQSPLEAMVSAAYGGQEIRLALSAGAPEPARNRKASAAILDLTGRIKGFAKISASPLAHKLLEHEASFLSVLAANPAVCDSVPRLIASGKIDQRFVMLQAPVTGGAASLELSSAHRKFLSSLSCGEAKPAIMTAMVKGLSERLAAVGSAAFGLAEPIGHVQALLSGCRVPTTAVHGDFTPWNIRQTRDRLCCYDWEYGLADGLPLIDQTHHELQVGYLLRNWTVEKADHELHQSARAQARFAPAHAAALQNVYLIDVLLRLAEEGYTSANNMVNWTQQLLQEQHAGIRR